jgi:hypothetical protein
MHNPGYHYYFHFPGLKFIQLLHRGLAFSRVIDNAVISEADVCVSYQARQKNMCNTGN